jgi:hypothetical protein
MNSSNQTIHSLQYWHDQFGSTPALDALYMALLTPFSALAFLFNLISYFILCEKPFEKISFYKLLRWYALNNAIMSLVLTFTFTSQTFTVFDFTNSYGAMLYKGYFQLTLILSFYYNMSITEMCILFERLKYFLPARFKSYKILNFERFSYALLAFSICINLPNSFILAPSYLDVEVENNSKCRIHSLAPTHFAQTIIFRVINYFIFIFRDLLTLLTKLVLNILATVLIQRYMARIKKEKKEFAIKISSNELHSNKIESNSNQTVGYVSKMQRRQIYLVLIRSTFSILRHILCIATFVLFFFEGSIPVDLIFYSFMLIVSIECFSNIFLLYNFYELFRAELKKKMKSFSFKLFKTK